MVSFLNYGYAAAMLASAGAGFVLPAAECFRNSPGLQRLGEAHTAGLFLAVALCHMLDSAMDHFTKYCQMNKIHTDYPVVALLVGVSFATLVLMETFMSLYVEDCPVQDNHTHLELEPRAHSQLHKSNGGGHSYGSDHSHSHEHRHTHSRSNVTEESASVKSNQRSRSTTGNSSSLNNYANAQLAIEVDSKGGPDEPDKVERMSMRMALTLAGIFVLTSPVALLASAAWNIGADHLLATVIQSIACGTFLYLDFQVIAEMKHSAKGGKWGHSHNCARIHTDNSSTWKAIVAMIFMSAHAVFDGLAVSTSSGSRAAVICFAIVVHKFWVSFALSSQLQKAVGSESLSNPKLPTESTPLQKGEGVDKILKASRLADAIKEALVFVVGFGVVAAVATVM